MQVASLVSADRLVLDERKITQRDTSLDNPSADKAFRRSRGPVRARSAHFRKASFSLPPLHGHAVALENNGPTAYPILSVLRFLPPPSLPLPFPP